MSSLMPFAVFEATLLVLLLFAFGLWQAERGRRLRAEDRANEYESMWIYATDDAQKWYRRYLILADGADPSEQPWVTGKGPDPTTKSSIDASAITASPITVLDPPEVDRE